MTFKHVVLAVLLLLVAPRLVRYLRTKPRGRHLSRDMPAPAEGAGAESVEAPTTETDVAGESPVSFIMEDGTIVSASDDLDPDGRLRYLGEHLLPENVSHP
jgi:hypothetical protein